MLPRLEGDARAYSMHYPQFDPVIFGLGPLQVRWYGLMYLLAFGTVYLLGLSRLRATGFQRADLTDLIFHGVAGVVIGGRAGFVLVYGFETFLEDPLWLFRLWEGGMSFHGGLVGVCVAMWLWARRRGKRFLAVADFMAPLVPVGLGLGRIGNFINTELPGRVTDAAWGMYFPCFSVREHALTCLGEYEPVLRHVSSVYQALTEGLALFVVTWFFAARPRPPGAVTGMFLLAYGGLRFVTEFWRQPDAHMGFVALDFLSMGQVLSIPMAAIGAFLLLRKPAAP